MATSALQMRTARQDNLAGIPEAELLSCAQNGDLDAFNQLVCRYQGRIFELTFRILGDEPSAEDACQNTFLSAYRSLSRFRGECFHGWLYRIAINACYDQLRRRKTQPLPLPETDDPDEERVLPIDHFSSIILTPEQEYDRLEVQQAVQKSLGQLEPEQRTVVVLVDLQDFSYTEAARVLGIPIGTVKSRLVRGRTRLHGLLCIR